MADYKLWNALKDAKKYRWVELSHSLNNESPYWSGIPEGSVELAKTVWDWGKPELECLIQTFKFPGQFGTHIDFPGHFIKGKALSEKYDVNDLIFPLVVIDISQQAKKDPRYAVTVEDIKAYEAKYGPIPDGALVALRSDWYKKWPDMDALSGIDAEGKENAPRLVAGSIGVYLQGAQRRRQRPRNAGYRFLCGGGGKGRPGLRALCSGQRQAAGGGACKSG